MAEYQVIARRFRPQTFAEVLGQDAIVTTLKNAIQRQRLATAYLFCGSRGTGKTTLARVFAKALNCTSPTSDFEPCNACASCKEIALGTSLDVLEIDGASHRGIDDVRQINETVCYAASSGKYKIYIIDEVHMLTKEAFNALLKTLEEPPPKVKFFFATTEAHKVLPTILSRCQRFNLNRISSERIVEKLAYVCTSLGVDYEDEALRLIAKRAEGGLRDAESLLDQIIAFQENTLSSAAVNSILGIMPKDVLFRLDHAGKAGDYGTVFAVSEELFSQGKDYVHFIEMLIEHYRTIMLMRSGASLPTSLSLPEPEREAYKQVVSLYTPEQCIAILDLLVEAQSQVRFAASPRFALESLLLKVMRMHHRIPIEFLVRRLAELEARMSQSPSSTETVSDPTNVVKTNISPPPIQHERQTISKLPDAAVTAPSDRSVSDTSPPLKEASATQPETPQSTEIQPPSPARVKTTDQQPESDSSNLLPQHRYDTLLQFAAVELEGTVQIKKIQR